MARPTVLALVSAKPVNSPDAGPRRVPRDAAAVDDGRERFRQLAADWARAVGIHSQVHRDHPPILYDYNSTLVLTGSRAKSLVSEAAAASPPATECGAVRGVSPFLFGRVSLAQPALGSPPLGIGGRASRRPRLETYAKG
jgi:hypothetical protein